MLAASLRVRALRRLVPAALSLLVVAALSSSSREARAQAVDLRLWGVDGPVNATAMSGNTLYVGGSFAHAGQCMGSFARTDASTGALAAGFPEVSGTVTSIVSDGSGGWFIGGWFGSVGGQPRANLAHIDADGSLLPWNPGAGSGVTAMCVQAGTLYVGGAFAALDGTPRNHLGAFDVASGSLAGWNPGAGGAVTCLLADGGTIWAGGMFTTIGGQARAHVAAIDATSGAVTAWNPGAGATVTELAAANGVVYMVGAFTNVGGAARNSAAAVDSASGAMTAWNPSPDAVATSVVTAGGTVWLGGSFSSAGGQARAGLAALDPVTGLATTWNAALAPANASVAQLVLAGGTLYVAGQFGALEGSPRTGAAAVDTVTALATSWDPGFAFSCLATDLVGAIVGGSFRKLAGAQPRSNLAAFDVTTGQVTAWNPGADGAVNALAVGNGSVYVGGIFATLGGVPRQYLGAVDAGTGATTSWNPGPNASVNVLSLNGSTVYAGGGFSTIAGTRRSNLAALDATSGVATAWDPGPGAAVYAIATQGNTVYVGGDFQYFSGTTANGVRHRIAAISATTGGLSTWNPSVPNDRVNAILPTPASVFIGGVFTIVGGLTHRSIASLSATTGAVTGDLWPGSLLIGPVTSLAMNGSVLYVGGDFSYSANGQNGYAPAALDTTTGYPAFTLNATETYAAVRTLAMGPGELFAGGSFTGFGSAHANLAGITLGAVQVTLAPADVNEGQSGLTPVALRFGLTQTSAATVSVDWTTVDGTATVADGDYQAASGTVTFLPGETSKTVTVNVVGDAVYEPAEFFSIRVSNVVNAAPPASSLVTVSIWNDDPIPSLTVGDVTMGEGDSSTTAFTFTLTLNGLSSQPTSVRYATADSTAMVADGDYAAASGTATFPPRASTPVQVTVFVNGDTLPEGDELFKLVLSNPVGLTLARTVALGKILNDDGVPPPQLAVAPVTVTEGQAGVTPATLHVVLSYASGRLASVDWATVDSSATAASGDYQAASGTLTFSPGETDKTITVNVNGDRTFEPDERFVVRFSNAVRALLPFPATVTVGIRNDDTAPTLTVADIALAEGNGGTTAFTFTLALSNASYLPVSVACATTDSTATVANNDYVPASGTATIPPEVSTTAQVTVQVVGDTLLEPDEVFALLLSNAVNTTLARSMAIGRILSDEVGPVITAVSDVASDQGGWVWLDLDRCLFDAPTETLHPTLTYNVWRLVTPAAEPAAGATAATAATPAPRGAVPLSREARAQLADWPVFVQDGVTYLRGGASATGAGQDFPPGTWAIVNSFAAFQQAHYKVLAPTQADSPYVSRYVVSAHCATPSFWYVGSAGSGVSVDDIPPGIPAAFTAAPGVGGIHLAWAASGANDFQVFRVYRGDAPGFVAGPSTLQHETTDLAWTDPAPGQGTMYYALVALDHAGNASAPATASASMTFDILAGVPTAFALQPPTPNPSSGAATCALALPEPATAHVSVYDAAGRRVRAWERAALPAGWYRVTWDGRDDSGARAAPGVYLVRVDAARFHATRRLVKLP